MTKLPSHDRRTFLAGILPACALTCLAAREGVCDPSEEEKPHKFDQKSGEPLSLRQQLGTRYFEVIGFLRGLEQELGVEALKCDTDSQIAGAVGAALFARVLYLKSRKGS